MEGFRIVRHEALTDTYRRVILEQIRMSMDYCRRSDNEPDLATHEIRKCTKRIRAIYRLFRKVTGETAFRHGQERFRAISGMLSEHRTSKVHIDVLYDIEMDKRLNLDRGIMLKLLEIFQESHQRLTVKTVEKDHLFQRVKTLLADELIRLENRPVSPCNFDMLEVIFKKTYLSARKNLEVVQSQYSAENIHAFRKTVKCLWNQVSLIRPVWPSNVGMTVHYLDMLAERLGYDHDLDDLYQYLSQDRGIKDLVIPVHLHEYIDRKRKHLLKRITPFAVRLFSEKPGSFAGRLATYYKIYAEEPSNK
jgi:CHAD domain-containing protein